MAKALFTGTGVALITPFRKQETIDFSSLEKMINHIITSGVDYIVALGTTSEAATLSESERAALCQFIVETVDSRVPIMLGMGGNNTRAVTDAIGQTNFDGISGILSVTPFYNKPQQRGLIQHFKNIADVSPVPVVLYNVPGRTSCNMTAETTLQLAEECPNIVAIKEASGNMSQVMEILRCKPANFNVISGDDSLTLPMMAIGANGVISVMANALPKEMSDMVHFALKGDIKKALPLHNRMLPLMNAIFEEGNPGGIKALLEIEGFITNSVRLPLSKVSKTLYNKLTTLYNAL
ncbi:MAG: 4-hydroxy-tetrahydrodipicolinate synthase [Bacteroidales bacterium]|nr:4-hydroxy-tetrahydrodipicolinate synthase [Bacteroidales bacterium]MBP5516995.1 4-hydroxy-tetrahydrodipicolinate synthase [Bacteroidales bacterium]